MTSETYLIYIDESYDSNSYAYSALMIPISEWNSAFDMVVRWRRYIKDQAGIPVRHELHATDFTAGRSHPNNNRKKGFRGFIFRQTFYLIENLPNVKIINAFAHKKSNYMRLFERMMNRINRTLKAHDAFGVLVCDEGNEGKLITMVRKMKKHNIIPDMVAVFGVGGTRNIPIDRIIEDPLFKASHASYFLQLADFLAFGLLRSETPHHNTHSYVKNAFDLLDTKLVKNAFASDPKKKGIIRDT